MLGDGAVWIWNIASEYFPDAIQIVDRFHAKQRLSEVGKAIYAFIKTYRPVLDDEPFRAFATMEDYRRWCESQLPDWLGYGRV